VSEKRHMPTISVIIPAYNATRTILETIHSVQQQTVSDFEMIVINDGSTDALLAELETVSDPRLKVFSYDNGGLSVARNRGLAHATGEFIAFLDADDLWTPDKLELQLAALQRHPQAGVAYSGTYYMDELGQSFHIDQNVSLSGNVYANLLVSNFLAHGSNPLIRRTAIDSVGEFNPAVSGAADWDYWLRLAANWEFVAVPKAQIFYRQSSSSMSSKVEFMERCQLEVIEQAFDRAPARLQHLKKQSLAKIYQYSVQLYIARTEDAEGIRRARQKLRTAIQLYPPMVFERKTQKLMVKLFLLGVLPDRLSRGLLKRVSQAKAKPIEKSNAYPIDPVI
jgi:glycosyltransferase involved in cell wall biosynthesis